jgi:hypothetical protein
VDLIGYFGEIHLKLTLNAVELCTRAEEPLVQLRHVFVVHPLPSYTSRLTSYGPVLESSYGPVLESSYGPVLESSYGPVLESGALVTGDLAPQVGLPVAPPTCPSSPSLRGWRRSPAPPNLPTPSPARSRL